MFSLRWNSVSLFSWSRTGALVLSQLRFSIYLRKGTIGLSCLWEVLLAGVAVMVRDKYAVRLVAEQREESPTHLVRGW